MKPILFNTDMVKALSENRKTVTRRVVKGYPLGHLELDVDGSIIGVYDQFEGNVFPIMDYAPYRPGDILYVRETWYKDAGRYMYKANYTDNEKFYVNGSEVSIKWHPSIHMPKEAARLFGRVTGLKAQRVQDITDEEARREGAADREDFRRVWNSCYAKPRPVKGEDGEIDHYDSYPWEDIHETRTYRGKPWYVIGNPWVWVIEFKRITKEVTEDG